MSRGAALLITLLAASCAAEQENRQEVRPELDVYVSEGSRIRFIFQNLIQQGIGTAYSEGRFAYFVEFALRPLIRTELRRTPDVFRRKYLTFRAGYQYSTSFLNSSASSENRAIAEFAAKYPLPRGFVLIDRNRGELRFIHDESASGRYRNRLWLERDLKLKTVALTPYAYDEIFFDTRYHDWSANRVVVGLQFPVASTLIVEPYLLRQINYQGSVRRTEAVGLKFSFYF